MGKEAYQTSEIVDRFADDVAESASRAIRGSGLSDVSRLLGETERMAHRSPGVFIVLSVVAGFAAARFIKSSRHRRNQQDLEIAAGRQDMSHMKAWHEEDLSWKDNAIPTQTDPPVNRSGDHSSNPGA